jgi:3-dehydrosphinganine reductase
MELKPYDITVSLSYPPDTDTPGYKEEMLTKPSLTREISETGVVVPPTEVARDIVYYSTKGYYGISTGFDGWLIKQLHPGMSPVNSAWEVTQQVMFSSVMRVISVFYVLYWDMLVAKAVVKSSAPVVETKKTK